VTGAASYLAAMSFVVGLIFLPETKDLKSM
jgi:hypothetical protein